MMHGAAAAAVARARAVWASVEEWMGAGVVRLPPSRVGQHVSIGMDAARSVTTRLGDAGWRPNLAQVCHFSLRSSGIALWPLAAASVLRGPRRAAQKTHSTASSNGGGDVIQRWW